MPDVYAEFIPEIDGSAVPRVEVTRGAAAVGEGRSCRLDAGVFDVEGLLPLPAPTPVTGADGIFDMGAPNAATWGAVREYAVDVSTGRTLPG
jgi:hypothetical protein